MDPPFSEHSAKLADLYQFTLQEEEFESYEESLHLIYSTYFQCKSLFQRAQILLSFCTLLSQCYNKEGRLKQEGPLIIKKRKKLQSQRGIQLKKLVSKLAVYSRKVNRFLLEGQFYLTYMEKVQDLLFENEPGQLPTYLQQLAQINSQFHIIPSSAIHKSHPTSHPKYIPTLCYVNFYVHELLFIEGKPIKAESNLLYCPLLLIANEVKISPWYVRQLKSFYENWDELNLQISIQYYRQQWLTYDTSSVEIFQMDERCEELRKIRKFVFLFQLGSWLKKIFAKDNFDDSILITLSSAYSISISFEHGQRQRKGRWEPKILVSFLNFCFGQQNGECSRKKLIHNMKEMFRLITRRM